MKNKGPSFPDRLSILATLLACALIPQAASAVDSDFSPSDDLDRSLAGPAPAVEGVPVVRELYVDQDGIDVPNCV
jgi:hypothetical protein